MSDNHMPVPGAGCAPSSTMLDPEVEIKPQVGMMEPASSPQPTPGASTRTGEVSSPTRLASSSSKNKLKPLFTTKEIPLHGRPPPKPRPAPRKRKKPPPTTAPFSTGPRLIPSGRVEMESSAPSGRVDVPVSGSSSASSMAQAQPHGAVEVPDSATESSATSSPAPSAEADEWPEPRSKRLRVALPALETEPFMSTNSSSHPSPSPYEPLSSLPSESSGPTYYSHGFHAQLSAHPYSYYEVPEFYQVPSPPVSREAPPTPAFSERMPPSPLVTGPRPGLDYPTETSQQSPAFPSALPAAALQASTQAYSVTRSLRPLSIPHHNGLPAAITGIHSSGASASPAISAHPSQSSPPPMYGLRPTHAQAVPPGTGLTFPQTPSPLTSQPSPTTSIPGSSQLSQSMRTQTYPRAVAHHTQPSQSQPSCPSNSAIRQRQQSELLMAHAQLAPGSSASVSLPAGGLDSSSSVQQSMFSPSSYQMTSLPSSDLPTQPHAQPHQNQNRHGLLPDTRHPPPHPSSPSQGQAFVDTPPDFYGRDAHFSSMSVSMPKAQYSNWPDFPGQASRGSVHVDHPDAISPPPTAVDRGSGGNGGGRGGTMTRSNSGGEQLLYGYDDIYGETNYFPMFSPQQHSQHSQQINPSQDFPQHSQLPQQSQGQTAYDQRLMHGQEPSYPYPETPQPQQQQTYQSYFYAQPYEQSQEHQQLPPQRTQPQAQAYPQAHAYPQQHAHVPETTYYPDFRPSAERGASSPPGTGSSSLTYFSAGPPIPHGHQHHHHSSADGSDGSLNGWR